MQSARSLLRLRATNSFIRRTPVSASPLRTFTISSRLTASKEAPGKDDMNVEPNEYSKSGSDTKAAGVEDAAFSKDKTRPEEQRNQAEAESGNNVNPLDASPANTEFSKPQGAHPEQNGHEGSSAQSGKGPSDRARSSGKGSSPKNGQ